MTQIPVDRVNGMAFSDNHYQYTLLIALWMRIKGPHNYMVTTLGLYVRSGPYTLPTLVGAGHQ
jgi:hypothetical protein